MHTIKKEKNTHYHYKSKNKRHFVFFDNFLIS